MVEIKIACLSVSGDGGETWTDIPIGGGTVKVEFRKQQPPNVIDSTCRVVGADTAIVKYEGGKHG